MISKRTALLVAGGIVFTYMALISGDRQLMFSAAVLLLFPAVVYAFTGRKNLTVERELSNTIMYEDENVDVSLRLSNSGSSMGNVEVYDELPRYSRVVDGSNHGKFVLPRGGEAHLRYSITIPLRGRYILGPTVLRTSDPYLLFYGTEVRSLPSELVVYPRPESINSLGFRALQEIKPYGAGVMRKPGSGKEFHRIREYQPSDPMRNINWKVYARLRKLMVNEYEKEDVNYTYIFLDSREVAGIGNVARNPLERMIKGAIGVAEASLELGNTVFFVTHGEKVEMIKAGGRDALTKIMDTATDIYAGGETSIRDALKSIRHEMPGRGLVFIFHTLLADEGVIPALQTLAAEGHTIIVVSPAMGSYTDHETREKAKYHIYMHRREQLIRRANGIGAHVIVWSSGSNLNDLLLRKVIAA